MKKKATFLDSLIWIPLTVLLAYSYARVWLTQESLHFDEKPFIYRQFVPLAASWVVWLTGLPRGHSVVIVVIVCALVLAWGLQDLYRVFHDG